MLYDPSKTAIVVIDLQKGITAFPTTPLSSREVIDNAAKLVKQFRAQSSPVFLVHVGPHDGKDALHPVTDLPPQPARELPNDWAEFVPELDLQPSDLVIRKRQWGAFHGTELDLQLRRRGIDTIVLCGIATSIGVETTAREAYQHGYNQIFVSDATTDLNDETHKTTFTYVFPKIGRIRTTEAVLKNE
ncbi:hydrolase [Alicyclobacillus cycloheptanicus]|uniref:Nicotinamidase-related amidase n=1 Tax=Alicyclobacillus cycloheptanicus TaxID=1457 RepID=A0ABT9XEI1_9BACL|nr:hydrolase [Alicyclobacillus cycloheptanicus]MDQ0188597.1 nicotinamidase-related amidase [Alicyclobacillus cycloheptanicus]WDM01276.1 hydrolase [Alicyclobacillus cycloheptanicus]